MCCFWTLRITSSSFVEFYKEYTNCSLQKIALSIYPQRRKMYQRRTRKHTNGILELTKKILNLNRLKQKLSFILIQLNCTRAYKLHWKLMTMTSWSRLIQTTIRNRYSRQTIKWNKALQLTLGEQVAVSSSSLKITSISSKPLPKKNCYCFKALLMTSTNIIMNRKVKRLHPCSQ